MRRLLLFAVAVLAFVGCDNLFEEEKVFALSDNLEIADRVYANIDDEQTRTYVENGTTLCWNSGDAISVFQPQISNIHYIFEGETGDKGGSFAVADGASYPQGVTLSARYALYPYSSSNSISTSGEITTLLPAVQHYEKNSFGVGANTMVAVTSSVQDKEFYFKNAVGYLKLKLYGANTTVGSITIEGNNDEKLSGSARVLATYGATPVTTMNNTATKSVTLDCGEGVELSVDAENPTEFWVVVPPTTFESGITITVTDTEGGVFEKSTDKQIAIERNVIQPMSAVEAEFEVYDPTKPAKNEIWYTSTDGEIVDLIFAPCLGIHEVSNTYENGKGVMTFDADVTSISREAFRDCTNLKSIVFPNSVTTIGECAFEECSGLTSVTIPDSVTTIGELAFYKCSNLIGVTIPDSVPTIERCTFEGCSSLTNVTIGDSVTKIGKEAFFGCANLKNIIIPDSVISIGYLAFYGCDSLTSVTIHDGVATVGGAAFTCCDNLKEFKGKFASEDGRCLIIDGELNSFAPAGLTEYTIPDGVTTIGEYAFDGCNSLTSVTIPDSVTTIGDSAFCECYSLTDVTIPDSVTTIGYDAFYNCDSLTSVTIGNSVTVIGGWAFCDCDSLTTITIPDSVTWIGDYAFKGCVRLMSITIPNSVTTIGCSAFRGCVSLTSVTIPDSVTAIWDQAFADCSGVVDITIGQGVTSIGDDAFNGTTGGKLTVNCNVPWAAFDGANFTEVVIGDNVEEIGNSAFSGCGSLKSLRIGDGVTTVGDYAFKSCSNLTMVEIGDSVEYIGIDAFAECIRLSEVHISDVAAWCNIEYHTQGSNPLTIAGNLYLNAELVNNLVIPNGVTTIGKYCFKNCECVESLTIPDSVTTIGHSAFYGCRGLTKLTIPESVTEIDHYAFYHCKNLQGIYFKATTPPLLGSDVFRYYGYSERYGDYVNMILDCPIYVPTESVKLYKEASSWWEYVTKIVGYDF